MFYLCKIISLQRSGISESTPASKPGRKSTVSPSSEKKQPSSHFFHQKIFKPKFSQAASVFLISSNLRILWHMSIFHAIQ